MTIPKEISVCIFALFSLTFFGYTSGHTLTEQEVRAYNVSKKVSSACPTYLVGYDEDNVPVWIVNTGQWDFRTLVEKGLGDDLDIWMNKLIIWMRDSGKKSDEVTGFNVIVDLDGLSLRQASSPQGNFIFESIWHLGRPLLGKLQENMELCGTNPSTWKPKLLRKIPRNQLPEKYGGFPDFKPVAVYD